MGEPEQAEGLKLTAVEIGGWGPIRAPVRLELSWPITVLVGRNGSGKTVLLEGISAGLDQPTGTEDLLQMEGHPTQFALEWSQDACYRYEYHVLRGGGRRPPRGSASEARWTERCFRSDTGEVVWEQDGGRLNLAGGAVAVVLPPDLSFLRLRGEDVDAPVDAAWRVPHARLKGVSSVSALVWADLGRLSRVPVVLERAEGQASLEEHWEVEGESFAGLTTHHLAPVLWYLARKHPITFDELLVLGRRVGVLDTLTFPEIGPRDTPRVEVHVDGLNLGLHSDGTIRALAILVQLAMSPPGGLLLIDEIESSFHPGLLSRILEELSAYAGDLQIILSTQSLRVVDWASPEQIRIVEREGGTIQVRALPEEKVRWLKEHLDESFTLSDHVYGGGLDDT